MKDEKALHTPCYIINTCKFQENFKLMQNEFQKYWGDNTIFGYSVKTNHFSELLKSAKMMGMYAEVVSDDEYKTAIEYGYPPGKIIYNGPQKTKKMLFKALTDKNIINIDNFNDLKLLLDIMRNFNCSDVQIGLRVNFNLEKDCPGETTAGNEVSRFGLCIENGDLDKAITLLRNNGIKISGLHMHYSSKSRSTLIFKKLTEKAIKLIQVYKLSSELTFIDIGGGFFLGMNEITEGKPKIDEYAYVICNQLKKHINPQKVKLILEPGAALIATAVDYLTSIINERSIRDTKILTIDGTSLDINPFMTKKDYIYKIINYTSENRKQINKQIVCGSTCMENDRLIRIEKGIELKIGDHLHFYCVGAYTMGFNNCFINLPPYIYSKTNENEYKLIRHNNKNLMLYI